MKRFTESTKWEKPWFNDLPPHLKCLWLYICDKADAAGVWEPNWKVASMLIGKTVTKADLTHFNGRLIALKDGKFLIGSFIEFQYGKLSNDCRAHIPVFRLIERHKTAIGYPDSLCDRLSDSLQEQVQEQEEEKEQDKTPAKQSENKGRGTIEEIKAFCLEIGIPESDGESLFHKWEGSGWKNGSAAIKCWRSTIRSWRAAGYLPSQKNPQQVKEKVAYWTPTHPDAFRPQDDLLREAFIKNHGDNPKAASVIQKLDAMQNGEPAPL